MIETHSRVRGRGCQWMSTHDSLSLLEHVLNANVACSAPGWLGEVRVRLCKFNRVVKLEQALLLRGSAQDIFRLATHFNHYPQKTTALNSLTGSLHDAVFSGVRPRNGLPMTLCFR